MVFTQWGTGPGLPYLLTNIYPALKRGSASGVTTATMATTFQVNCKICRLYGIELQSPMIWILLQHAMTGEAFCSSHYETYHNKMVAKALS